MRFRIFRFFRARLGTLVLFISMSAVLSFMIAGASSAQQPVDSRPRTTGTATDVPSPTPQVSQPTQTPAPSLPGRRIAPQLGAPPPPPVLKQKPPDPKTAEIDENSTLKIDTELVTLNVRVIDRNNHPIGNLRQGDFKVLEDGVSQPVFFFTQQEVPVIYGMAIDTSGSTRPIFTQILDAAKTILNSNKRGDETFIERFISSDKIETVQDFTANKDMLLDGLDSLYIEGGQTAVIDGVYLAAEHVAEYKKGGDDDRRRRALIVVTDGEDRASYYPETELFKRLREEDVQIYLIGFVNELDSDKGFIRKSPRDKAVNLINRIASETGGRAFFPQSIAELPQVANEIVRDLRTQYVLSYDPTNKAHDGTYRQIKVVVDQPLGSDKRIALTRSGRTAPREGATVSRPATKTTTSPANNNVRQPATNPRKSP